MSGKVHLIHVGEEGHRWAMRTSTVYPYSNLGAESSHEAHGGFVPLVFIVAFLHDPFHAGLSGLDHQVLKRAQSGPEGEEDAIFDSGRHEDKLLVVDESCKH